MKTIIVISMALLAGCATRADLLAEEPVATFVSSRQSKELLGCFQRNIAETVLSDKPMQVINSGVEPLEIIVDTVAVIRIRSAEKGSIAKFHVAGRAAIYNLPSRITRGCE